MDTKMLFFDIDGTLITEEDGKMPVQYILVQLKIWHIREVIFCLSTQEGQKRVSLRNC